QPRPGLEPRDVPGGGRRKLAVAYAAGRPAHLRTVLGGAGGGGVGVEPGSGAGSVPVLSAAHGMRLRAGALPWPRRRAGAMVALAARARRRSRDAPGLLTPRLHGRLSSPVVDDLPPQAQPRARPGPLPPAAAGLRLHPR